VIVPPVFVHCGFGLLLAAFSLPLVLRLVPMNRAYGIRIPEAFRSDACWYDINAYGGRLFLVYGVLLAALGFLARDLAPPTASLWSPVFIVGPLLVALALLSPVRSYARRRVQQGP
jgi:SdpI/YhfL family protein